ncbi:metallophosphoesterase [Xanthocytophaga agilis]|uniref:Metallophosphoesterase n=1 Tax=Xanthocytophaga agilis TaxID=3048010 RepID=A0AAE3RB73_9BACT|nr:metallophosphoesterase [Xanthocytophaga agilis]MDJ1504173.1 metallophosphoesterase [Xanthocytophaga agilis]
MSSPFSYKNFSIPNPISGRRFVVPDIHGFAHTFRTLVEEQLQLRQADQLFLLGDYIDRGPDSVGVIDFILQLQEEGYQVFPLKGNHEENFLDNYIHYHQGVYQKFFLQSIQSEKLYKLLDKDMHLLPEYSAFFDCLTNYFELDRFYLVHAGFRFSSIQPFEDFDAMLTIRRFQHNPTQKTIVHGHDVTDLDIIRHRIEQRNNIIPLDNGCYYGPVLDQLKTISPLQNVGKLLALNLDTFELYEQKNVG